MKGVRKNGGVVLVGKIIQLIHRKTNVHTVDTVYKGVSVKKEIRRVKKVESVTISGH